MSIFFIYLLWKMKKKLETLTFISSFDDNDYKILIWGKYLT